MKKNIDKLILILIFIFIIYSSLHIYLYSINKEFHTIDAPNHVLFCFQFYRNLDSTVKNPNLDLISKLKKCYTYFRKGIIYWPKFVHLTSIPFIYLFGLSLNSIKYANLVYLFILMLYTYLLSYTLTRDKINSLLISSILPLFPMMFEAIQGYGLDFPLTSGLVMFFYLLIKTNYFTKINYTFYAGLVFGILWLIKGQVIIFTGLPLVWILIMGIINTKRENDIHKLFLILANFSIFIILSYGIASIWWNGRFLVVWNGLKEHTISNTKHLESYPLEEYKSLSYYGFYLKYLFKQGLGPLLCTVFILLNIIFYIRKKSSKKFLLFLWMAIPLIVFSLLFQVKQLRFIMPIVPGLTICAGSAFSGKGRWKYILWFVIICILWLQLIQPSFASRKPVNKLFSQNVNIRRWNSVEYTYKITQACMESLEGKLSPDKYKVVIFKYVPVEDGPLSFQFWLELLGYKRGFYFYTHDFLDQYYSVYEWLRNENHKEKLLCIFLNDRDIDIKKALSKNMISNKMDDFIPCAQKYKNDACFIELVDKILPEIKDELEYISRFECWDLKGEVYKL